MRGIAKPPHQIQNACISSATQCSLRDSIASFASVLFIGSGSNSSSLAPYSSPSTCLSSFSSFQVKSHWERKSFQDFRAFSSNALGIVSRRLSHQSGFLITHATIGVLDSTVTVNPRKLRGSQ
jgi:hypothetical protein